MTEAAMSLSAAVSGCVLFLLSLSVVQSKDNNGVTYTSTQICAFKGSTVDIGCSFNQPLKLSKEIWLTERNEYNPDDLKKDSGRVSYSPHWKNCTLTIRDLRESDSAVYKFRYITNQGGLTVLPGVTLTVTALQVHVETSSNSNWATLICQSSCRLYNDISYIWYKNGQKISTRDLYWYKEYLKRSDSYSCALRGHEDFPSPSVCYQGDSCNRVNYSNRRICAFKGSSVDISSTYNSYESPIQLTSWFRSGRGSEDLREDSQYAGRVEVIETERGRSTLRIRDLTESDSAQYHFKFKTQRFEWKSSLPGTTLTVTDVQVSVSTGRKLDCVTRCNPYVSSYVWYKNGQQVNGVSSSSYEAPYDTSNSYSCALKGFEDFHSPLVCVDGERCNRVNYSNRRICAVKGSSVDISSTYNSYESPIQSTSWFRSGRGSEDLREDSQYADRVDVIETERGRSTLRIRDLTESDSAEYHFKFKTQRFEWKSSLPGTTLTVTALQVKVSRIISVHESQTEAELKCESSCSPAGRLSFVWFKNNQFMVEQSSYQNLFSPGDVISCAFKGHEDYRSASVYIPEVPSVSVSPSAEIVEGSSVTLTCSSDANPAVKYTWYKEQKPISQKKQIIFRSIQSSDSGAYYCTAEHEVGQRSSEVISINVKYAPKLPSVSVSPSKEIVEGSSVTPSGEIGDDGPVTLTHSTVSFSPDIGNNQDSWKKTAVVASVTVLILAVIIICGIIFIRRKGCFKTNSSRERPDNKPEENAYYYMFDPAPSGRPEHDGPSAPPASAQSRAAEEQQDDLCYSSVTFIKKPEEHDYYNILPIKAKRRKEKDEEVTDVDYTVVRLNSTQRLRDQQAAEYSSALYSTVRKK